MDRRNFFRLLGAGVAGVALEQAIPLGRVWSFPTTIVVPTEAYFIVEGLERLQRNFRFREFDEFSLRYLQPAIDRLVKDDDRLFSQVFVPY